MPVPPEVEDEPLVPEPMDGLVVVPMPEPELLPDVPLPVLPPMVEPDVPFIPVPLLPMLLVPMLLVPPVPMPDDPLVPVVLPDEPELFGSVDPGVVDMDPPLVPGEPPTPLPLLPLVWAKPLPAPAARINAAAAPIIHRFILSSFREAPRSSGPFR